MVTEGVYRVIIYVEVIPQTKRVLDMVIDCAKTMTARWHPVSASDPLSNNEQGGKECKTTN